MADTMTLDQIVRYNADWLQAWTDKDVARLLQFYAEDCLYKDAQTAAGITGHAALSAYLTGLFAATPAMTYTPDEVWPTPAASAAAGTARSPASAACAASTW